MTGESTARASSSNTPLRRRTHGLERASRSHSFTTAESSTRNGDHSESETEIGREGEGLPSPPMSFADEEDEEEDKDGEDQSGTGTGTSAPRMTRREEDIDEDTDEYSEHVPQPWYRPSISVLLALAPPIGNWLTGGDHLKDLLMLLLLVFYLHQLVEVPWNLYHAARPRRSPLPAVPHAPSLIAARAQSELRTFEIILLVTCVLTPALGVLLLRSLTSFASRSTPDTQPISWFSTAIFALVTGIRPLRELASRITTRTSTLHTRVHAHTLPSRPRVDDEQTESSKEVAALRAEVERLTSLIIERDAVLYAHLDDALSPLEQGMHRLERRVGKLRAARKQTAASPTSAGTGGGSAIAGGSTANTIFVPASGSGKRQRPRIPPPLLAWFGGGGAPPPQATPPSLTPPPISPSSLKRRTLASIPEEGEPSSYPLPTPVPNPRTGVAPAYGNGIGAALFALLAGLLTQLGTLTRQCAAASVALLLYPLYLVLLPVRGALRVLLGVV